MKLTQAKVGLLVKRKDVAGVYGFIAGIAQNQREIPEAVLLIDWQDGKRSAIHSDNIELVPAEM